MSTTIYDINVVLGGIRYRETLIDIGSALVLVRKRLDRRRPLAAKLAPLREQGRAQSRNTGHTLNLYSIHLTSCEFFLVVCSMAALTRGGRLFNTLMVCRRFAEIKDFRKASKLASRARAAPSWRAVVLRLFVGSIRTGGIANTN